MKFISLVNKNKFIKSLKLNTFKDYLIIRIKYFILRVAKLKIIKLK